MGSNIPTCILIMIYQRLDVCIFPITMFFSIHINTEIYHIIFHFNCHFLVIFPSIIKYTYTAQLSIVILEF